MSEHEARMTAEIKEAPEIVRRQKDSLGAPIAELVARLKKKPPQFVVTCARGSSAHAAVFAKHSIERNLGLAVADAAPSIVTVYHKTLALKDQLFLALSQSGRSDDLIEQTKSARGAGALTVGLINDVASPLAAACDIVLPIGAGPELSVAATKTFIGTLAAILRLTAAWSANRALDDALTRLPKRLEQASALDWSACFTALVPAASMMTIGRGPTLAIAAEAALKLKETCLLHAEAFSGSEFLHGPVALVTKAYPILLFMPADAAANALHELETDLRTKGAAIFSTQFTMAGLAPPTEAAEQRRRDPDRASTQFTMAGLDPATQRPRVRAAKESASSILAALPADHPETDAICLIQSFYAMAVRLAKLRGADADKPRHLKKVTRTR